MALATALLAAVAMAAPRIDVVLQDADLLPGRTAEVVVAAVDGTAAVERPPTLDAVGALVRTPVPVRPGVWTVGLEPDAGQEEVRLTARVGDEEVSRTWPVGRPPAPPMRVPEAVDGAVRDPQITFLVTGDDVPPVDALEVVVGEGAVADLVPVDGGVEVTVQLDEQPFPRVVPVGLRDRRGHAAPVWTTVRLRARPRLPLQAEPGASLVLRVGGREYGPFEADEEGRIVASVDQYPGERVAQGVFRDDLGNVTRTDLPLVSPSGVTLVALASGELVSGRPPPVVYLAAARQDGAPWGDERPTCRTPASDLEVTELAPGEWVAALRPLRQPEDVRVECTVAGVTRVLKVRMADGIAHDLQLRLWPEELRSDLPVGEVRVVLEDVRGERLSVDGVRVDAARGDVTVDGSGGIVLRGEYDGAAAIDAGEDTVRALYDPPRGEGIVEELQLAWSRVPSSAGEIEVHARALDARRRPLSGVPLTLTVEGAGAERTTGDDGWATAALRIETEGEPLRLEARSRWRSHTTLVLPGSEAHGGPGTPRLTAVQRVTISPSRVSGISVEVDPAVLRAGPGAVAWVYVTLEDRSGRPITDEAVTVSASEGTVGELHTRSDGTIVATYEPEAGESSREVQITARTDGLRSNARLTIEPRVVRLGLGPWVGYLSNFGTVSGPVVGADFDVRTRARLVGESLLLRLGVSGYGFRTVADTGVGPAAELRSSVVLLTGAVLFRDDRGPWAFWGGGGASVAAHRMQVRFGDDLVSEGSRLLVGPTLIGGGSRRLLGGELLLTVRAHWLPAREEEVGYSGNVGGLAGGLGYRLVY